MDFPGGAPEYRSRPRGVTPVAVIGIIFGIFGIFCLGCAGLISLAHLNNPSAAHLTHGELVAQSISAFIGLALAILLLSGSIGALTLAAWARKAMIVFAALDLIFATYRCIDYLTVGAPEIMRAIQNPTLPANPTTQQVQGAQFLRSHGPEIHNGLIAFAIAVYAIQAAYCIWILFVMRRPDVIDAFEGTQPPGPPPGYSPPFPPMPPPQQRY